MKFSLVLILVFLLFSCSTKVDEKEFDNGDVSVKTYTIVKAYVQSSNPNKSYVDVIKNGKKENILIYNTYGVNNIEIAFKENVIEIKPMDEQTFYLIQSSNLLKKRVFNYDIKKPNP
ncbi:hypothetical protein PG326_02930 [Riemerella anatipestifer]|nr:hypothetical protein [Riemerella anatipestifer]MDY3357289.1 hypothetical protein [Riemerella anatipestifer]